MTKYSEITKDTNRARDYFMDKVAFTVGPVELKKIIEEESDNAIVVDVRTADSYKEGHIPSAVSVPAKDLLGNLSHFSKEKINIVYCYTQQCHLAAKCAIILAENGYPVIELEGGINEWKNYGYDLV